MRKSLLLFVTSLVYIFTSCDQNTEDSAASILGDNFNRKEILENWADNIIIPAFQNFKSASSDLSTKATNFKNDPSQSNLDELRSSWRSAYIEWQKVSLYETGKAESINRRNFTNLYPTDPDGIKGNISSGTYDLTLPSQFSRQGFPALEYLLYAIANSDVDILSEISTSNYTLYIEQLAQRIQDLNQQALDDWLNGYRNTFVENDGSDATSSLNIMTNDFLFYYEKFLRAAKVGNPAGVFSSSSTKPEIAEAIYVKDLSKTLLSTGLETTINFFNGVSFDSTTNGTSFDDYLDFLETKKDDNDLSTLINDQWDIAKNQISLLDDDIATQVQTDNLVALKAFDELQVNVINIKVDMFQAMNVVADFQDADGD